MHRSTDVLTKGKSRTAACLLSGMLLILVRGAAAAGPDAVLSGVVRDAEGVVQMGALVQVITPGARTIATVFTDQHGRYAVQHLSPGTYMVRASQTLFVPATRNSLRLQAGGSAVVNLTLTALFDMASWLPAERRTAAEADDDWKWTLRSPANRPILRMIDGGEVVEVSSSLPRSAAEADAHSTHARATVASGDGGFGQGGVHNILTLHRTLDDGGDMLLRADVASSRVPASYGPSQELVAGYEHRLGYGGAGRSVVAYKAHPELLGAGGDTGLSVLEVSSAERFAVADVLELEAGGSAEAVHAAGVAVQSHPFVRVTAHAPGAWTVRYSMASDRATQSYDDISVDRGDIPVALVTDGRLTLERGRHQEISVGRDAARGTIQVVVYHDALDRTVLSGGGASGPAETNPGTLQAGMLVDPTTGTFKTFGQGYSTRGVRLVAGVPVTSNLWVAAEYSSGSALASETGNAEHFAQTLSRTRVRASQAATISVKGKVAASKTLVRASYRWQPAEFISAVDPYSAESDQAFLSCSVRQPVKFGQHAAHGLYATLDITNLLAEGYRPFVSEDGHTLYFAQAPRTIQAGLSFSF